MQARKNVESVSLGRPPAENPRNVQISFRVDQSTGDELDRELQIERRPGLILSRNDMARMLMSEALAARQAARRAKPKK